MTKSELAHVCAELTDNLPKKFERIGARLIAQMAEANRFHCGDLAYHNAEGTIDGILTALAILDIPYELHIEECGDYISVEIAGETFYVSQENGAETGKGESG